jgi:hypothetical protein
MVELMETTMDGRRLLPETPGNYAVTTTPDSIIRHFLGRQHRFGVTLREVFHQTLRGGGDGEPRVFLDVLVSCFLEPP